MVSAWQSERIAPRSTRARQKSVSSLKSARLAGLDDRFRSLPVGGHAAVDASSALPASGGGPPAIKPPRSESPGSLRGDTRRDSRSPASRGDRGIRRARPLPPEPTAHESP